MPWNPSKRTRQWRVVDQRRQSKEQRGYGGAWEETSLLYRRAHPLCVHCLLQGRVQPAQAVDHIVPIACCPSLRDEETNWASLCWSCHSYKTTQEPRHQWTPDVRRIVACGLPGTGKSRWARRRGAAYFDADELGLERPTQIIAARRRFMHEHQGACTVIVASTVSASIVASELRGVARHFTTIYRRGARPGEKNLRPFDRGQQAK